MMLDDRKAAILCAVVQEYIETAQPVGSSRIVDAPGVEVSSATVRNEMVALEEQGYLAQPHTSAGRIPTDTGYRFFVDTLTGARTGEALTAGDRRTVTNFFEQAHGELESMLAHTGELLSQLTDWTSVVIAPGVEAATVRSAQLVDLASHSVLVVAVLSNGVIEKRVVESETELTADIVADASHRLARAVEGRTMAELSGLVDDELAARDGGERDGLLRAAIDALVAASSGAEVFVGGASRVASAFDAVEQVRDVLSILEKQVVVVTLVHDVLDRGLRVAIGEETGYEPLAECSLVVAPYEIEGEPTGTIGVLGPTRMNYPQALSAVAVVSARLGEALSDG